MKRMMIGMSLAFVFCGACSAHAQRVRLTARVVDFDTGLPVSNMTVEAWVDTNIKSGWGWGAGKPNITSGMTDTNGVCVLDGDGDGGTAGISVPNTPDYYGASCGVKFTNVTIGIGGRKWQPWNPVLELRLHKVRNPIPLYAKCFGAVAPDVKIPEFGKPIGFDLLKTDWVKPYGKGEQSDFVFTINVQKGGVTKDGYQNYDASFSLGFSNEGDGIQSVYAFPKPGVRLLREAPEHGYETNLVRKAYNHDDGTYREHREDQNYYFRVRTKKDDKGNIVSALYGKIHDEIGWLGAIRFTYYLNPTPNDRNLEFAGKDNLFKPHWKENEPPAP